MNAEKRPKVIVKYMWEWDVSKVSVDSALRRSQWYRAETLELFLYGPQCL